MVFKIKRLNIFLCLLIIAAAAALICGFSAQKDAVVSSEAGVSLPIVMYHQVTERNSSAGRYVLKKSELIRDFDYIREKGYQTVTVADLIDYVHGKKELPKKIIMITFDDGFESTYRLVQPLLAERKMKAVVSPVGSVTEQYTQSGDKNINYAYMTWDEIAELDKSEEFEVQNHSYDMHHVSRNGRKGLSRMNGESRESYEKALTEDLTKMQSLLLKNSSVHATAAVYPYGAYSAATLPIIKRLGFQCSMVCEEKINSIRTGDPDGLFNLGRFNRPSGTPTQAFFERLMKEGS